MRDPVMFCIKCDRRYGVAEEYCSGCGFDPIDGGADETAQYEAVLKYKEEQDANPR